MATLYTVLDIESEVERVFYALFAATFTAGVLVTKSATGTEMTTPRIGIVAEVKRTGGQRYRCDTGVFAGRIFFVEYEVQLTIEMIVNVAVSAVAMATYRGKLRAALTDYATIRTAFASTGYLSLIGESLRQSEGSRLVDSEEKEETARTVLQLTLVLSPAALEAATAS